jgi:acyl-CoA dehydrogenase
MIAYGDYERAQGLNWYDVDPNLRLLMDRIVPAEDRAWCETKLRRMGEVCGGLVAAGAELSDKCPPRLERYDRWGEEVNEVVHHPAVLASKRALCEAGFTGLPWSAEARGRGRPVPSALMLAFNYLLCQADTGLACAVGMTGGAAELVERYAEPAVRDRFLPRLVSMNYDEALDGAMFLTEKQGGSDLGSLTTVARKTAAGWRLDGAKWFCSNVDAQVIMALARPEGAPAGVRGIGLFLVPKRRSDGRPNGVHVRRVKDKLGTRTVPTAEVDLEDAEAYLLAGDGGGDAAGPDGRGLNRMMEMVTTSRLGVAAMGLGIMRRSFLEAAIYAWRREAFGHRLRDLPLVRETLVRMVVELEAAAGLVFAAVSTDRDELGQGVRRLLVPLAKFRATRRGIETASLAVEIHGGNGYIENWPFARQLRDAQCHTIWEGTENIICLDVLRSMRKALAHEALFTWVEGTLERSAGGRDGVDGLLDGARTAVTEALAGARQGVAALAGAPSDLVQLEARRVTDAFADLAAATVLIDEAAWEIREHGSARKAVIADLFADALRPRRPLGTPRRAVLELFDPLVAYGPVAPADAAKGLGVRGASAAA